MMDESIRNILQALYEESPVIKTYVDGILAGNPIPYTLIGTSDIGEKNQTIVDEATKKYYELNSMKPEMRGTEEDTLLDYLGDLLDLDMVLEEDDEDFEVFMMNGDFEVSGSRQIVKGGKVADLKKYADFKRYEFVFTKVVK